MRFLFHISVSVIASSALALSPRGFRTNSVEVGTLASLLSACQAGTHSQRPCTCSPLPSLGLCLHAIALPIAHLSTHTPLTWYIVGPHPPLPQSFPHQEQKLHESMIAVNSVQGCNCSAKKSVWCRRRSVFIHPREAIRSTRGNEETRNVSELSTPLPWFGRSAVLQQ